MAMIAATMVLVGCQTSKVDKTETASIEELALNPTSELDKGKRQFLDANYGLAENHFRRAVEQSPESTEALMGLAASYDQLGRYDFAERAYKQLFKVGGRKPQIVSNYGYSQLLQGKKAEARKLFNEAALSMPGDKRIAANLKLAG